jgi:small-conductance mechanosensitive channel
MESAGSFIGSRAFIIIVTILLAMAALAILNRAFERLKKHKNSVYLGFIQGVLQAVIVVIALVRIMGTSTTADKFYNTILLSSSLLIVVLGFIFQEGMKNIIHGFFISIYRPFEVGDRVHVNVNGAEITGYIDSMTLRHTVVRNAATGALEYIPNSVLDLLLLENYSNGNRVNSQVLNVTVTYDSDLEKAKQIFSEVLRTTPEYIDTRTADEKDTPIPVLVGDLSANGIVLSAGVNAATQEKLFFVCSDVREKLYHEFEKNGIRFAGAHTQLSGELKVQREKQPKEKKTTAE